MLLAVDVGNTQTVLGLFEGDMLARHWRIATDKTSTADELRVMISGLFALSPHADKDVDAIALSSVVPALTDCWVEIAHSLGLEPLVVTAKIDTGLAMHYENPAEIGADRLADAVAAIDRYGKPAIVVDLGTATNIEVIDAEGAFCGGIIAPGLVTSANALFDAAARLSRIDLEEPEHAIGSNTRMAVQSGLMYGEVARIDGLVRRVKDELGYDAPVIATGGLAARIASLSQTVTAVDENLTLWGLRLLFDRNR